MNTKQSILVCLSLCCAGLDLFAGEKPKVAVRLEITARVPRVKYRDSLSAIQTTGAREMIRALSANLGCIQFSSDSVSDTLLIRISDRDPATSNSSLGDIVYRMTMKGRNFVNQPDPLDWLFEAAQDVDMEFDRANEYVRRASMKFEQILQTPSEKDRLITQLLGKVPIADTVFAIRDALRWVMPFTPDDLKTGALSRYRVLCEFDLSDWTERREYVVEARGVYRRQDSMLDSRFRCGILTLTVSGDSTMLHSATPMKIKQLYIERYLQPSVSTDLLGQCR